MLRREVDPGTWVLPGGFVDVGETVEEAASRETYEETGLTVAALDLLGVYSDRERGIVAVVHISESSGNPQAGQETVEVRWFGVDAIPWANLGFETTSQALKEWSLRIDTPQDAGH